MKSGDSLVLQSKWKEALERFQRALQLRPGDLLASGRVAFCRRRLNPQLKGFQVLGDDFDPVTGWPARVEVPWLKLRMVLIGGGTIDIGDPTLPDSRLVHTVHVEPFYLSQYEVTQEQWLKVMGFNPSAHQDGFRDHLQMPAENISWKDCQQFIERLNGRVDGKGFRLPTEAEWEYVARKGAQNNTGLDAVAWYRDNAQTKESRKEEPTAFTAPRTVGLKSGSALGLYDMQGNVWEWCSTLFWPYPYNPHDGREDSTREGLRALRGGSYADRADLLAVGLRHGERSDRRFRWNGLRLARSVPSD